MDIETLAMIFCGRLRTAAPGALKERYGVEPSGEMTDLEIMEAIGRRRGFLVSGGEINYERTAIVLLDEFRSQKLGKITLEWP